MTVVIPLRDSAGSVLEITVTLSDYSVSGILGRAGPALISPNLGAWKALLGSPCAPARPLKLQYWCNPGRCQSLRSEPTASRVAGQDPPAASAS